MIINNEAQDVMQAIRKALKAKQLRKNLKKDSKDGSKMMISSKTAGFFNERASR